jgi:hypothetical protein
MRRRYASDWPMRFRVVVLATLAAHSAWAADARIEFFAKQLSSASDPRARAQAALALGASNDRDAITPLCKGLDDSTEIVRLSVAKALGQLANLASLDCLKRHASDSSTDVRDAVQRALAALDSQQTRSGTGALYVALAPVLDKQDRPNSAWVKLAEERLHAALGAMGVTLAPPGESKAAATSVVRGRHMKGFALNPELHTYPPSGLRMSILVLTYPDHSILGEVSVKASGAGPPDLIRALAPKVIQEAAETFDWSR